MIAGAILVVCGLLIAIFPELLSLVVAAILIFTGVLLTLTAYQYRQHGRHGETRVFRYIIRH